MYAVLRRILQKIVNTRGVKEINMKGIPQWIRKNNSDWDPHQEKQTARFPVEIANLVLHQGHAPSYSSDLGQSTPMEFELRSYPATRRGRNVRERHDGNSQELCGSIREIRLALRSLN